MASTENAPMDDSIDDVPLRQRFAVMLDHARLFEGFVDADQFRRMRKHLGWYCKGFPHAAAMRARMFQARSVRDVENTVTDFMGDDFLSSLVSGREPAGMPA